MCPINLWLLVAGELFTVNALTVGVIGGSGRLGSRVVTKLLERGDTVRCLTRSLEREQRAGVSYIEGTVGDVESLKTLLRGCDVCIAAFGATRRTSWTDLWNDCETLPDHAKQVNYVGWQCRNQGCISLGNSIIFFKFFFNFF